MTDFYIGVMSGTSLDGVDVALCEIKTQSFELIHSVEYKFNEKLKSDILRVINGTTTLKEVGEIDTRLSYLFAHAINTFIEKKGIDRASIEAIGLHGQTLWHDPNNKYPFSLQLGSPTQVAVRTGIKVVSNFRQRDIAMGGQGAPFAPAFHQYMFSRLHTNTAVLNIGGMANLTLINEELLGYDTGCGNVLMDYWISDKKGLSYDKDGKWASSGVVNDELLYLMLQDPYFSLEPPKSTGREYFNRKWLNKHLEKFTALKDEDVQATLLELTAMSIVNEVKKTSTELLVVCGGGLRNTKLMQRMEAELSGVEVVSSDECGVSSKFMEAMTFAWLAYQKLHRKKVPLSSVTGAREDSILGVVYE